MRTARDIIRITIALIEADISTAESNYAYADAETKRTIEDKKLCVESGTGILVAESTYNWRIGYYDGITFENEHRIEALKTRLDYYKSLDKKCAEEEMLEEVKEDAE